MLKLPASKSGASHGPAAVLLCLALAVPALAQPSVPALRADPERMQARIERWWDVTIDGVANHGGTTPMDRRFDSLVSASELVLAVNSVALDLPGRQVATVGRIQAYPGAPNVVPGRTVMSLEIRDLDAEKMQFVFEQIEMAAEEIAGRRGTPIRFEEIDTASPPAPTDETMRDVIAGAAEYLGYSFRRMPSGAGHDAQDLAKITPTGMIFVPSRDGISHSPEEYTAPEDMARGASVLFHTIMDIDQRPGR